MRVLTYCVYINISSRSRSHYNVVQKMLILLSNLIFSFIKTIYILSQKISDNFDSPNIHYYCDTNHGNLKMKGESRMFHNQRYITCGIETEIPLEL